MKQKPKIVSWFKHENGMYEIVVLHEQVKYHYFLPFTKKLEGILKAPVFTYKRWSWIQQNGRLTHRDAA